ncbi:MAG: hypothetical protein O7D91_04595 [Planctomycetota bacterium]|nr:hypothetical protein [Planctomycetota bacterium]
MSYVTEPDRHELQEVRSRCGISPSCCPDSLQAIWHVTRRMAYHIISRRFNPDRRLYGKCSRHDALDDTAMEAASAFICDLCPDKEDCPWAKFPHKLSLEAYFGVAMLHKVVNIGREQYGWKRPSKQQPLPDELRTIDEKTGSLIHPSTIPLDGPSTTEDPSDPRSTSGFDEIEIKDAVATLLAAVQELGLRPDVLRAHELLLEGHPGQEVAQQLGFPKVGTMHKAIHDMRAKIRLNCPWVYDVFPSLRPRRRCALDAAS